MNNPRLIYYKNGNVKSEYWFLNNQNRHLDKPSIIYYFNNGKIQSEYWRDKDVSHRLYGPATIIYDEYGNIINTRWIMHGKLIKPLYDNYPLTKEQIIEIKLMYE